MRLPNQVLQPLRSAWKAQKRWLLAGAHGSRAHQPTCAPTGRPGLLTLGLMAALSESLRRIQRQFPSSIHTCYIDDRAWATSEATECANIGRTWTTEVTIWGLTENNSKRDFAAFGGRKRQQALAGTLSVTGTPGTIQTRLKILGTHIQLTRKHDGAAPPEKAAIKQALQVARWTRSLPHPHMDRLYFAKATGIAKVAAASFSRLPAQQELQPLRKAVYTAANANAAFLARLLLGHTADVFFRTGSTACIQTLRAATESPEIRARWSPKQSQGPIGICIRWPQRTGWTLIYCMMHYDTL